jgi:hypothetical protein
MFVVQATVDTIVNYDCNKFIAQVIAFTFARSVFSWCTPVSTEIIEGFIYFTLITTLYTIDSLPFLLSLIPVTLSHPKSNP